MDSLLQEAMLAIQRATGGMTVEQLAWHPDGKWSTAEILEHLTLTYTGTARSMQRVAESGTTSPSTRTWKQRLSAFVVTGIGYFPSGRKSPEMVEPKSCHPTSAVERIERELRNMDAVLGQVETKIGSKVRVPHPILGPLTLQQWRKFHRVHTLHHVKQIEALKEKQKHV